MVKYTAALIHKAFCRLHQPVKIQSGLGSSNIIYIFLKVILRFIYIT